MPEVQSAASPEEVKGESRSSPGQWQKRGIFLVTLLGTLALDQLSKQWIRSSLALGQSSPPEGFVRLTHVNNSGAAFGLFADGSFPLLIPTIIAAAAIALYYKYPPLNNIPGRSALGALLGGAAGNIIDRLRFSGNVTDFIDIGPWPVFNLADTAVVTGIAILMYVLLFPPGEARKGRS